MPKMLQFKDNQGRPIDVKTSIIAVYDNNGRSLSESINTQIVNDRLLPIVKPEDFVGDTMAEKVIAANQFILDAGGGFELYFGDNNTYLITQAIVLPSNTTLRAENCTIQMADNTVDNMVRTANIIPDPDHPLGHALNKMDMPVCRNIRILGENATFLMEENASQSGATTVGWRGTTFCMVGVDGFEIAGLTIEKNLSWTFNISSCINGSIHDIVFNTTRENGDGIDIAGYNIDIYNISGTTQDDTIAIGTVSSERYTKRPVEVNLPIIPHYYDYNFAFGSKTYDIRVKDVHTNGTNHVLILIAGGHEVYGVSGSNIDDNNDGQTGKNAIIKIYGGQYTGSYYHGIIHDCFFNDIKGYNCTKATIWLSEGVVKDGHLNNIKTTSGKSSVLNESGVTISDYGMSITNQTAL